jgi:hypothetical protein
VVVWAEPGSEDAVAAGLRDRFPGADVIALAVAREGAGRL